MLCGSNSLNDLVWVRPNLLNWPPTVSLCKLVDLNPVLNGIHVIEVEVQLDFLTIARPPVVVVVVDIDVTNLDLAADDRQVMTDMNLPQNEDGLVHLSDAKVSFHFAYMMYNPNNMILNYFLALENIGRFFGLNPGS